MLLKSQNGYFGHSQREGRFQVLSLSFLFCSGKYVKIVPNMLLGKVIAEYKIKSVFMVGISSLVQKSVFKKTEV